MNTPRLEPMIREHGLAGRAHLLGARCDVERLLPAIDICCLSSAFGEGFPNVLGEAMASGVPCVATDVGDAALLLGGTGKVVPPRNPQALADACAELIALDPGERQRLGQAARRRIKEHYDLTVIVKQYERFYDDLALRRVVAPCAG
jgi:glycosyltransferase involved in cell wall biosynthesis